MTTVVDETPSVLRTCTEELFRRLKQAGVPVSIDAHVVALEAIGLVELSSSEQLRSALKSALVKDETHLDTFHRVFNETFELKGLDKIEQQRIVSGTELDIFSPNTEFVDSEDDIGEAIASALGSGDPEQIRTVARLAVSKYAVDIADLTLGVNFHYFNTLQQVDLEAIAEGIEMDPSELRRLTQLFKDQVAAELRRRQMLLAPAINPISSALDRAKPVGDIDFLYAADAELKQIEVHVKAIAKKLAARLRMRHQKRRKEIDLRATAKLSIKTQGVPLRLQYKTPTKRRPELVVLADLSGSVATFAKFTLNLMHAISEELTSLRIFGFIDEVDEITDYFVRDFDETARQIAVQANMVGPDRHSNYGNVFSAFVSRHLGVIDARSTVLVLGDARNNFHDRNDYDFRKIAERAKRIYWLNPESQDQWGTSDSVIYSYTNNVDSVHEVRNLNQLQRFVELL